jgi:signal transduction histidine kinase/HAMP domain-containing protein
MKIRTQYIISIVLFAAVLVTLATSLFIISGRQARYNRQQEIVNGIERSARELSYFADSYLLYGESQQRTRWESTWDVISRDLSRLEATGAEEQAVIDSIRPNLANLKSVFAEVAAALERNSQTPGDFFDRAFIQVSWSRLEVLNQGIIFDAARLFDVIDNRLDQTRQNSNILLFMLLAIFAVYLLVNYLLLFRRTLRSIEVLRYGARVVGSGNLDYTIPAAGRDEISDLSRAFNSMTASLKTVTASKADLEKEIELRKEFEADLRKTGEQLRISNQELEENSARLKKEIDERQRAEEAIRRQQAEMQTLFENIPAGLVLFDAAHPYKVLIHNRYYQELFAEPFRSRGMVGLNVYQYAPEVQASGVAAVFDEVVRTKQPKSFLDFPYNTNPFRETWFNWYMAPITIDGKVVALVSMSLDVTERHNFEQQLKDRTRDLEVANQELEAFNYSVSHDLRTPLRALESYSDLLMADFNDRLEGEGKDYLDRIRKASQQMSHLTADMLKLSRIVRADMEMEEIDLTDLGESVLAEIRAVHNSRRAEIKIKPGMLARGDKPLVTIALRNLLENAWKYTAKCSPACIEMSETEKDGVRAYFVRDNGIGFDMRYQDKLFQPFQRLNTSQDYPGTGIGLAIAQRVIQRHGGKIWAESEVGKGTTFYFTLSPSSQ